MSISSISAQSSAITGNVAGAPPGDLAGLVPSVHEPQRPTSPVTTDRSLYGRRRLLQESGIGTDFWSDEPHRFLAERERTGREISRFVRERLTGAPPDSSSLPQADVDVRVTDRWEGVVIRVDVEAGFFTAQFVERGKSNPKLVGDFVLDEVEDDDLELVRPGALFYITAGRFRVSRHRWQQTSSLRFRRIPSLSEHELADAFEYAGKMRDKLGLSD